MSRTILDPPKYRALEPGPHLLILKTDLQIGRGRFRWRRSGDYENPEAIAAPTSLLRRLRPPILAVSQRGTDGVD